MEEIKIVEKTFECDLTQLEDAIKTVREIVGEGDCWINVTKNKIHFIDDYGNEFVNIIFE